MLDMNVQLSFFLRVTALCMHVLLSYACGLTFLLLLVHWDSTTSGFISLLSCVRPRDMIRDLTHIHVLSIQILVHYSCTMYAVL